MQPSSELLKLLRERVATVVLTGAGISAESGIATFRGGTGSLWDKFRPEELASADGFLANPKLVWEWYQWRRRLINEAGPNPGHLTLAEMEKELPNFTLITQNVDNLHQRAGSREVIELHGNIHRNKCQRCAAPFPDVDFEPERLPQCPCGGSIRPDVVWFGEMLPEAALNLATQRSAKARLFFSIGTSAVVYPAADLPLIAKRCGAYLVEINPEETMLTPFADEVFSAPSGSALPEIWRHVRSGIHAS